MNSSPLHKHLESAWKLTSTAKKIRHFNFFGSLIETIILSVTLIYQIGYVWLDVMHKKSDFFVWLREFATNLLWNHRLWFIGSVIWVGVFYFLVNFLLKNVFNAGLVYLIRAYMNRNEREYRVMPAFTFWWRKSVKLAEYQSFLFWSKPVYIFYIFFWGYRLLSEEWWLIFLMAGIFIVALVITRFLFEYARLFIILQDRWVFESLGLSMTMTIENIGVTFRLFFSLILVYLREIILLIGIFMLPFLLSWLVTLGLADVFLQGVFIVIGLVYLTFLIIVSAMNSVIEIFIESLWYSVFLENGWHAAHTSSHHGEWHGHGHGHDQHNAHHTHH